MKNQKYILSALAALSVLTAATSVTAFAGEETTIPENNAPEIITEAAEIPEVAVDSDAEAEEVTELDAETIADAEIEEDTEAVADAEIEEDAEVEEVTEAEEETVADTEIKEENHKHYGFCKWDCEDWCNFASWVGGAGWRCGRDQMPEATEEAENTAIEEETETEVEAETTYIQDWYDNHFDWKQFDENEDETVENTDEQFSEDDADKDFGYWKWDCWYPEGKDADKPDYECKDWYDFDWNQFGKNEEQGEDAEKEFIAPKHEHKNWHNGFEKPEEDAFEEEEQPFELTEEDTEAETEFTAPKYEHKNWWGFWDEIEEDTSDEDEVTKDEQDAEEEEGTSFVDWMFDEYFKNKHFKNTEDETHAENVDEETAELTEETEKTIYLLDVQ